VWELGNQKTGWKEENKVSAKRPPAGLDQHLGEQCGDESVRGAPSKKEEKGDAGRKTR